MQHSTVTVVNMRSVDGDPAVITHVTPTKMYSMVHTIPKSHPGGCNVERASGGVVKEAFGNRSLMREDVTLIETPNASDLTMLAASTIFDVFASFF